MLEKAKPIVK